MDNFRSIAVETRQIVPTERRGSRDNESREADVARLLYCQEMGADDILNVYPPIKQLVRLDIGNCSSR
jgi:hypothetical protein